MSKKFLIIVFISLFFLDTIFPIFQKFNEVSLRKLDREYKSIIEENNVLTDKNNFLKRKNSNLTNMINLKIIAQEKLNMTIPKKLIYVREGRNGEYNLIADFAFSKKKKLKRDIIALNRNE